MNKTISIVILGACFSLSLNAQQNNENFYYYQGEKIYLQQRTDKIFLKFTPDTNKEQILALINNDISLKLTSDVNLDNTILRIAILESKEKKSIPSATIDYYKTKKEVVSIAPKSKNSYYEKNYNSICNCLIVYVFFNFL